MHFLDHVFIVGKRFGNELHGIPCVVAAPVLPVLNHHIDRNLERTILAEHFKQFVGTLVAFAALHEAVCPEWSHWHLASELAYLSDSAVRITAIDHIVVGEVAHFRLELHAVGIVSKVGRRVVVPEEGITLGRMYDVDIVVTIALHHVVVRVASAHLAVLIDAYAIDWFFFVEREGLTNDVSTLVGTRSAFLKRHFLLLEQVLARSREANCTGLEINDSCHSACRNCSARFARNGNLRSDRWFGNDRQTLLFRHCCPRVLDNADDVW